MICKYGFSFSVATKWQCVRVAFLVGSSPFRTFISANYGAPGTYFPITGGVK